MRVFGLICLGLAVAALVSDFALEDPPGLKSIGHHWDMLHRESLQLLQPAVERHIHPELWASAVFPALLAPTAVVFGVIGVLVLALSFRRALARSRERYR